MCLPKDPLTWRLPCQVSIGVGNLQHWDLAEVLVDSVPDWQPWKLKSLFIQRPDGQQPPAPGHPHAPASLLGFPATGEAGGPVLCSLGCSSPPRSHYSSSTAICFLAVGVGLWGRGNQVQSLRISRGKLPGFGVRQAERASGRLRLRGRVSLRWRCCFGAGGVGCDHTTMGARALSVFRAT